LALVHLIVYNFLLKDLALKNFFTRVSRTSVARQTCIALQRSCIFQWVWSCGNLPISF